MSDLGWRAMLSKRAVVLLALLLAVAVPAEEPEQSAPAADESEQVEQGRNEAPKQGEFEPTEEIEEDYSVPFPVDI